MGEGEPWTCRIRQGSSSLKAFHVGAGLVASHSLSRIWAPCSGQTLCFCTSLPLLIPLEEEGTGVGFVSQEVGIPVMAACTEGPGPSFRSIEGGCGFPPHFPSFTLDGRNSCRLSHEVQVRCRDMWLPYCSQQILSGEGHSLGRKTPKRSARPGAAASWLSVIYSTSKTFDCSTCR